MTKSSAPSNKELASDDIGDEIVLKRHRILRVMRLQERLEIETATCSICDFNREIIYHGYYDDKNEIFNVCELCGKDLIARTKEIVDEVRKR